MLFADTGTQCHAGEHGHTRSWPVHDQGKAVAATEILFLTIRGAIRAAGCAQKCESLRSRDTDKGR